MTSRTLMLLTLLTGLQLFASTPEETAPKPVKEHRQHYVLRDADGTVHYEITEISRMSDDLHDMFALVQDPDHGSFLLISRLSWPDGQVSNSLTDIRQKDYIRVSYPMPTRARTVDELIAQGGLLAPVNLTLSTNGGEWKGLEAEWKCDFDESFGYPCAAAQLKRIKKAQETGKPLPLY